MRAPIFSPSKKATVVVPSFYAQRKGTDRRYFPGGGGTPSRPSKPPEKQHSPTAPLHNVNPESFTAFTTNSILLEDYRVSEDIPPGFEGQKSAKGIFSQ